MIADPRSRLQFQSARGAEGHPMPAHSSHVALPTALGRAVFALGLGPNQSLLLWHVLEWTYGGGTGPCPIDGPTLAASWGLHRHRVAEARRWLVQARILAEVDDGFAINEDVAGWVHPDDRTPLLQGDRPAYVAAAKAGWARPTLPRNETVHRVAPASQRNGQPCRATPQRNGQPFRPTLVNDTVDRVETVDRVVPVHKLLSDMARRSAGDTVDRVAPPSAGEATRSTVSSHVAEHASARAEFVFSSSDEEEKTKTSSSNGITCAERGAHAEPGAAAVGLATSGTPEDPPAPAHDPALIAAGKELRRAFGDAAAAKLKRNHAAIGVAIGGRWDYFRQAVLHAEAKLARPGAEPIRDVLVYLQGAVKGMVKEGAPVMALPKPKRPPGPALPTHVAPLPTPAEIEAYMARARERGRQNAAQAAAGASRAPVPRLTDDQIAEFRRTIPQRAAARRSNPDAQ